MSIIAQAFRHVRVTSVIERQSVICRSIRRYKNRERRWSIWRKTCICEHYKQFGTCFYDHYEQSQKGTRKKLQGSSVRRMSRVTGTRQTDHYPGFMLALETARTPNSTRSPSSRGKNGVKLVQGQLSQLHQLWRVASQPFGLNPMVQRPVNSGGRSVLETLLLCGFFREALQKAWDPRRAILACHSQCLPEAPRSLYWCQLRYFRILMLFSVYNRPINIGRSLISQNCYILAIDDLNIFSIITAHPVLLHTFKMGQNSHMYTSANVISAPEAIQFPTWNFSEKAKYGS